MPMAAANVQWQRPHESLAQMARAAGDQNSHRRSLQSRPLFPALGLFAFAFVLLELARSIERGIDDGCFLFVVEFAWPRPPFHGDLLGALQGELVRRSARTNCRSRA